MATLATGISATDTLLIIAGDVSGVEKGLRFRLDDEICDLAGFDRHVTVAGKRAPGPDRNRWIVERHVGTSAPASHDAGTTVEAVVSASVSGDDLTLPIPFAGTGDGAAGIPQGGSFTEDFDVGEFAVKGTDGGAGVAGGPLVLRSGAGNGGEAGATANIYLDGTTEEGGGGSVALQGGSGTAGMGGGLVSLTAGSGDEGNDPGSQIIAQPGDGAGNAGLVQLLSNGILFSVKQAANVPLLQLTASDPPTQLEVQGVADAVDALIASLIAGGWMAAS